MPRVPDKITYKFLTEGDGDDVEADGESFLSAWKINEGANHWIAEDAANHYYHECDGRESWKPIDTLTFRIFTENNQLIGSFDIEIEFTPVFMATKS